MAQIFTDGAALTNAGVIVDQTILDGAGVLAFAKQNLASPAVRYRTLNRDR